MLNKTIYNHFIAFMNILTGACLARPDKSLLADTSQLPQAISPGTWLSIYRQKDGPQGYLTPPAVKPSFLPRMEEEMVPTLYAAAFCISKGDQCVSVVV